MDKYNQADLLNDLVKIFPNFASCWQADMADDKFPSISLHSVYMSFLPFLACANPTPEQWKLVARHFSEAIAAGGDRENAADTCFFEGLKKGEISRILRPLLSEQARSYI
jgi:hypothetical protein